MLSIYCINLDRRTDRWNEAIQNFEQIGLSPTSVRRWSAISDLDFGALGCAKSHLAALSHFLTSETNSHCLILEDDFDFVRPWSELVESFNRIHEDNIDWDVLLLSGASVVAFTPLQQGIARVVEAQTTASYLVSRRYASAVIGCFAEAVTQMEGLRDLNPRQFVVSRLAIDIAWKTLQRRDRWFIFSPSFGVQRLSYSDIEQRAVDYKILSYGLKS